MLKVTEIDARVIPIQTRIPFRYGIATMVKAPHVVVKITLRDGRGAEANGFASEHLPPKWFTKDPATTFSDEISAMVQVIEQACHFARGLEGESAFDIWQKLDGLQHEWANRENLPGLLVSLGVALVERALLDATCRLLNSDFATALSEGILGFSPA